MLKKIVASAFMMISISAFAANDNEKLQEFLPDVTKATLAVFKNHAPVEININTGLQDGAQAAREYVNYAETTNCKISVNPGFYIFQEEVNPFLQIGLTTQSIRNFLMLHELAHCMDGEAPPDGIDPVAWREALGDGFAASMLYHKYQLSAPKIVRLSLFRNTNENGGAHKMLTYMGSRMERYGEKNIDPMIVLEKVKEIRREVFGVKLEKAAKPILALEEKKEESIEIKNATEELSKPKEVLIESITKNVEPILSPEKKKEEFTELKNADITTELAKIKEVPTETLTTKIEPTLVLEKIKEMRRDAIGLSSTNSDKLQN